MIAVDASVILEILLQKASANVFVERIFDTGETLHAPHLLDIETIHVLRRYARLGQR